MVTYNVRLFDKYLDHMLVKLEQNRMVHNIQNFELFDKNSGLFTPFLISVDAICEDVSAAETIV